MKVIIRKQSENHNNGNYTGRILCLNFTWITWKFKQIALEFKQMLEYLKNCLNVQATRAKFKPNSSVR